MVPLLYYLRNGLIMLELTKAMFGVLLFFLNVQIILL